MAEANLSEQLANHFVALRLAQIPADVVDAAKLHILDSIGCLIAGSGLEPGKLAYDLAVVASGACGDRGSTLFGTASQASLLEAVQ
ncbi:MAG TPA: MmgE/PrpD family protein, partial [Candidatus Binatus sp.]|nr:MmgE/PrpD family protein [Candidatus Binatus sp.]